MADDLSLREKRLIQAAGIADHRLPALSALPARRGRAGRAGRPARAAGHAATAATAAAARRRAPRRRPRRPPTFGPEAARPARQRRGDRLPERPAAAGPGRARGAAGADASADRAECGGVRSGGGELRLGFDGRRPGRRPAAAPAPAAPARAAQREEALRYRLGLAPRRAGGRVTGFTVRANVEMPALARAGIRPGDVIVARQRQRLRRGTAAGAGLADRQFDPHRLRGRARRPAPPPVLPAADAEWLHVTIRDMTGVVQ